MLTRIPRGLGNPAQLLPEHKTFLPWRMASSPSAKGTPQQTLCPVVLVGGTGTLHQSPVGSGRIADQACEARAERVHRGGRDVA